ncbi:MAG TPA: cation:proton antiporter, partial [Chryseobacterium sp.]
LIKAHSNTENLFALNVINADKNESSVKNADKLLHQATDAAAAADVKIQSLKRYDNDVINGVNNVIKEQNITDLIIGLEDEKGFSPSFAYNLYNGYLQSDDVNVLVYHAAQPLSTIKRYAVMIPENAHKEAGFFHALLRVWNMARNSGATITFYATEEILDILQKIIKKANIEAEFIIMNTWKDGEKTATQLKDNEALIVFMAKRGMRSYIPQMRLIPELMNKYLHDKNYLLIFPFSEFDNANSEKRSVGNHDDFMEIGNVIKKIFK